MRTARWTTATGRDARIPRLRRCRLRSDDEAGAGVVAILLSILIIILMITLVTSVWMPVWMEDKEAKHIRQATSDFNQIKSTIDNQILQGNTNFVISTPLSLGTEGSDIFGSDSTGTFAINYFRGAIPEYQCNVKNQGGTLNVTSTGGLKYTSNNRYYIDQRLAYENGAIILDQGEGELMRIGPQFAVEDLGPVTKVTFVMISVSGVETSMQGVGTVLIKTQLVTYTSDHYLFDPVDNLTIRILTEYPKAWEAYMKNTLLEAGLDPATDYDVTVSGGEVTVVVRSVQLFEVGYALVKVELEM